MSSNNRYGSSGSSKGASISRSHSKSDESARLLSPKDKLKSRASTDTVATDDDLGPDLDASTPPDSGTTLIVAFCLMLLFQLGNRIFGRLETFPMHNYPLFMNMLSTAIYVPICFAYIIPVIKFGNGAITKEQMEIPKYKFAVMGAYDSLAGIMQTFSVTYISSSSIIVLVQQSAIPISMAISSIFLQSQYTAAQYIGASVVLCGIVVVLIPTLSETPSASSTEPSNPYELLWILVLIVSCVPMCLSSVYKEKALGEVEIDVTYLNGWVSLFQFLIAIPLCFPSAYVISVPMDEIIPNMYNGMLCWIGINTVTAENAAAGQVIDDCTYGPFYVNTYLFFNVVYNFLIVVVLKHGSANILWMASTVIVPVSNIVFSFKSMPGSKPLTFWDFLGLLVIMTGLIIYRFSAQMMWLLDVLFGKEIPSESPLDAETARKLRKVNMKAEGKQLKYVGLNQIEALQTLVDIRVKKEQRKTLVRSSEQIRGSLLMKLGIPPSPHITIMSSPVLTSSSFAPSSSSNSLAGGPGVALTGMKRHSFVEKKSALPQVSSYTRIPTSTATGGALSGNSSTIMNRRGPISSFLDNSKSGLESDEKV